MRWALALLALFIAAESAAADKAVVTVSIEAPIGPDGAIWATKPISDSVKDLQKQLRRDKRLRIVAATAAPTIRITVLGRGVGSAPAGTFVTESATHSGIAVMALPMTRLDHWVHAEVLIGGVSWNMVGTYSAVAGNHAGAWTQCAKFIAEDVGAWVDANAIRLGLVDDTR